jgi:ribonuclease HII
MLNFYRIGVDEAGRGPLAGPVVAGAVVLPKKHGIVGLADSKTLSEKKRDALELVIKAKALRWGIGVASVEEIDEMNILQASLLAMRRAVAACGVFSGILLVDGNQSPRSGYAEELIVKGDTKVEEISAASILAKVARDREMLRLDALYPEYGLAGHMGYPTKAHCEALLRHGATPIHRKTFGPVRAVLFKR